MRKVVHVALAGVLGVGTVVGGAVAAQAAPITGQSGTAEYIVQLRPGADARGLAGRLGISPGTVYHEVFDGFAAELTRGQVTALQRNGAVRSIEPDAIATVVPTGKPTKPGGGGSTPSEPAPVTGGTQQLPADDALWGLDRIDQASGLSRTYTYESTGSGVTAYVVDTGIQTAHRDFGGRASLGFDNAAGRAKGGDCNGHGTHVAGTIGGSVHGVAKGVRLIGVRVLDCQGNGSYSDVIAGLDYVLGHRTGPSVVNLSLGGPESSLLDDAVARLVDSGVVVTVAAGNDAQDACGFSPSSAGPALTVAASDSSDALASFSNVGPCVDVAAPGQDITSTWLNDRTATLSGTSMAAPHVAGVAALFLGRPEFSAATPAEVAAWIAGAATVGAVSGEPAGTPELGLLNTGGL